MIRMKKTTLLIIVCGILICLAVAGIAIRLNNSIPVINTVLIEKIEVWTYPSFSYELTDEEIDEFLDIYYNSEYLGRTDGGTTPLYGIRVHYKSGKTLSIFDAQSTVFELRHSGDSSLKTHKIDSPALLNFIKQIEETHGEKQ